MIHISQFYSCSSVKLACEMYYICEIGKYLKYNYNECVSLDGVLLHNDLRKSKLWDYFRMAVDEGWVVNHGLEPEVVAINIQFPLDYDMNEISNHMMVLDKVEFDNEDHRMRQTDINYAYRIPQKFQVSFQSKDNGTWFWTISGEEGSKFIENNMAMNHGRADQSWLSLIAMVAVERLLGDKGVERLLLLFDKQTVLNPLAVSYVMLLTEYTNCLTGWCYFKFSDTMDNITVNQLGYTAWYAKGKDLGLLSRFYTATEKRAYMKTLDIIEGDIVMCYERDHQQRRNYVKSIAGCHVAKVLKISETAITFELIHTTKTYFHGKEDFEDKTIAVKKMFGGSYPYSNLRTERKNIDYIDLGIGYLLYNERYFIVDLNECDDARVTRVTDGSRKDTLLLNQNNLIYWILEDYNYSYNRDRFLKKYFENSEPLRDKYLRGETLDEDWYYSES